MDRFNKDKNNNVFNNNFATGFENIISSMSAGNNKKNNNNNHSNISKNKNNIIDFNVLNIERGLLKQDFASISRNIKQKLDKNRIDIHTGHRQRARERFLLNPYGTSDYDLLELLLFLIIPRADTKPMAKILLDKFKNISGIYNANPYELDKCGINSKALKYIFTLLKVMNNRILEENINNNISLNNLEDLVAYCRSLFTSMKEEEFYILFLDNKLKLIDKKKIGSNSIANVSSISQRKIIEDALELKAKNIALTHNHPSNDCSPSKNDILTTNTLKQSLKNIDVDVIEHIIVGSNSYFSFAENDLL